jgi:hypothetical protein
MIGATHAPKETPTQAKERLLVPKTIQFASQPNTNFIITSEMMFIDKETTKKPLKDIKTMDVALAKIPTKVLCKLYVRITQDI